MHTKTIIRPERLTLQEYAREARVSDVTIRRWIRSGYGPKPTKVGTRYRFQTSEVLAFLEGRTDSEADQ